MTVAYFDCFNGISGDMTLGALVDLGLPLDGLRTALASLPVQGYNITSTRVKRCGIAATLVRVEVTEKQPHRHFSHIRDIINNSGFSPDVKSRAIETFHRIAVTEAKIHETTLERIHFHEVGAVDAIVDIVGAVWGLDQLGVTRVMASPVVVGSGTVKCAHGVMPVPAPATALLLEGKPISTGPLVGEMTTPTGAAILTTLASSFGPMQNFIPKQTGYGAGSREYEGYPNYLRVLLGETVDGAAIAADEEELAIITTDIDDMPAEFFGNLQAVLLDAGCLDVSLESVQMKKNRPGTRVQVLTRPGDLSRLLEIIFRQTSTFGARVTPCRRYALRRRMETVETPLGPVAVKLGLWGDEVIKATPEYEECRRIALDKEVPLPIVFSEVNAAILRSGLLMNPHGRVLNETVPI